MKWEGLHSPTEVGESSFDLKDGRTEQSVAFFLKQMIRKSKNEGFSKNSPITS